MSTGKGGFGVNLDSTGRPKNLNKDNTMRCCTLPRATGPGGCAIAIQKTNRDLRINPETHRLEVRSQQS